MRKVVVCELLSLDGVAEAPDTFFGWDDAVDASLAEVIPTQDAVILGRRTYDEWVRFWPSSEIEPFATFINAVPKHVATSTPLDGDWANAAAIEAGVVDELRLTIGPMIAGRGRRLLDDLPPFQLEPIRSEVSPTGYLVLHHRVISPTAAADAR